MMLNQKDLMVYFNADEKRWNFLKGLLPIFVDQLNKSVAELNLAYQANNSKEFSSLIHKIKGSALTYGARTISKECVLIEEKQMNSEITTAIDLSELLDSVNYLNEIFKMK